MKNLVVTFSFGAKFIVIWIFVVAALPAPAARGQGNIAFANIAGGSFGTVNAPVRDETLPGSPLCAGTLYLAQLYVGAAGIQDMLLLTTNGVPRSPSPFLSGQQAGYHTADAVKTLIGYNPGQTITAQIRAWAASSGESWEMATVRGESNLIQVMLTSPTAEPAHMVGLQAYMLYTVPEPSTWALLALGSAALWCATRRRWK